jgi:O-antigen/teichoic acid export membrane protein
VQKLLKISQQTFWQIIVKVITTVSGFIILGIVSRNYGPAGTGNFTLALTYLAFFYTLADFGFNAEVLRRIKNLESRVKDQELQKLLATRIIWSLLLMVLAAILVLLLPQSFNIDFRLSVLVGSLIILFYAINQTAQVSFQTNHRYDLDIPGTIIGVMAGTIAIFFLALNNSPVYLLILGYVLAWLIHSSLSLFFSKKWASLKPFYDLLYIKSLFKDSWPIAGTLVLNTIYFRADAFILSYYHSAAEVGIYNLAYQFFQALLVLPTFIMNSFYPMMLETFKNNLSHFNKKIKLAAIGLFFGSLVLSLITYYLSPFLINLIAKSGFEGSISALQILSFGFPAYFLSALLMWVMVTKKMYKSLLVVYGLGLIFNVVANLIYIPNNSYLAASVITGLSEYLILILQVVILWLI